VANNNARTADRKTATDLIERALKAEPNNLGILSSSILVYHLIGESMQAMQQVETALQAGVLVQEIDSEPELRKLRAEAKYQELRIRYLQPR
jgi:Tfp pilus assembly protein PilF